MHKERKQTNKKRFRAALCTQQPFLIKELAQEWEILEKAARRETLVRHAKSGGIMIGKTILILLAIAGGITVAAVAPNVFGAIGQFSRKKKFFNKKDFQQTTRYLKNKKFIRVEKENNNYRLELTEEGKSSILAHAFHRLKIKPQIQWDGLWRIVLFDIPDRKRWERNSFREQLRVLGFTALQKSAFILPHPCDKELDFLISFFSLHEHIRRVTTKDIDNDSELREYFSIK